MTKTYSGGSNHDVTLLYKIWSQKPFCRNVMLNDQAVWLAERIMGLKLKNKSAKLLEMMNQSVAFMDAYPYTKITKISNIPQLSLDILQIKY